MSTALTYSISSTTSSYNSLLKILSSSSTSHTIFKRLFPKPIHKTPKNISLNKNNHNTLQRSSHPSQSLSLRVPRGGMIFFRKDPILGADLESAINNAGGPHNHTIGGLPVCLKHAQSPEFKAYRKQVTSNCKALANRLVELEYKLVSGGSDNHLVLVDLRPIVE